MTTFGWTRRRVVGAIGATALIPALRPRAARAQTLEKLSYQSSWRAQGEQGGFYQALATGLYKEHGLDVEIRAGGPQLDVNQLLLGGRVDIIESNAFAALNFAREKLPGVVVAAFMQKDPRVLLSHPGVGNDTLASLKGKPILVATAGRTSYWLWLKAKYGFTDDQVRPYTFNMAPFLADKTLTQQGLLTSEPFDLRKAGVDPVIHILADQGFDNYQTIAMTSPKLVKDKPEVVQRFVDASIKGWKSYLSGDPALADALIRKDNPDMSQEKIDYARASMLKHGIVTGGDAGRLGIGAMTPERWQSFYKAMVAAGAQADGVEIAPLFTTAFVNRKVGL